MSLRRPPRSAVTRHRSATPPVARGGLCIVGSDRVTRAGDVCNKIGTYLKALAARDNDIPFLVAAPSPSIDLTLDDLRRLTRTDMRVRHHCVEGWSAMASWHGVQMKTIAELVGADPAAGFVEFRSFDNGYYSSWDGESALHPQTLIAYGMNGEALPPGHGAPARLYGATKLGYKSVKFLTEILFMPHAAGAARE